MLRGALGSLWILVFAGCALALGGCASQIVVGDNNAPLSQGAHKPGINVAAHYSPQQRAELDALVSSTSEHPNRQAVHHVPVPRAKPQTIAAKRAKSPHRAEKGKTWIEALEFWK